MASGAISIAAAGLTDEAPLDKGPIEMKLQESPSFSPLLNREQSEAGGKEPLWVLSFSCFLFGFLPLSLVQLTRPH